MTLNSPSRIKTIIRDLLCLFVTVFLVIVSGSRAYAVSPENKIDKDAKGSLSIRFEDNDDAPVTGGNVELFFIASIGTDGNGNDTYVLEDDFVDDPIDYDNFGTAEYAQALYEVTVNKGLSGMIREVDQYGIAYYDDLQVGMYLVTQPIANDGWYAISPYIVTIPLESGDEWLYDIASVPKMSPYCEPLPATPEEPQEPVDPSVPSIPDMDEPVLPSDPDTEEPGIPGPEETEPSEGLPVNGPVPADSDSTSSGVHKADTPTPTASETPPPATQSVVATGEGYVPINNILSLIFIVSGTILIAGRARKDA